MSATLGTSILASGDPDLALFTGIQSYPHWSQTLHPTSPGYWMYTRLDNGGFGTANGSAMAIWAVRDGPVPVPGPSTPFLLVLMAGIGVSGMRRLRSVREEVQPSSER